MSRFKSKQNRPCPLIGFQHCLAKTTPDGKPGMSVEAHCRIVGSVARALIEKLPGPIQHRLPKDSAALVALHDIGKVSPGFQKKCFSEHLKSINPCLAVLNETGFETDHAMIGAAALNRFLGHSCELCSLAQVIASHHGSIRKECLEDTGGTFGGRVWAQEREKLIKVLLSEFGGELSLDLDASTQQLLAGLTSVADWIGSDEGFFPAAGLPDNIDLAALAKDAVSVCGFGFPELRQKLSFEDIVGVRPYETQSRFIGKIRKPGLYILESPMGSGKTEAALYAAYKLMAQGLNQGMYFGLPTRLTSNKIHERVMEFLEKICVNKQSAKLAHGSSWLSAFGHGDVNRDDDTNSPWFNPRKRKLLFPFAVGTIDQALLSVIRVRHSFVRAFGLAGKVVILDEVHSYDMYTGTLLDILVRRLLELECTVIVLSATLSGSRRRRLLSNAQSSTRKDDYPLITSEVEGKTEKIYAGSFSSRRYNIATVDWDSVMVAKKAVAQAETGECVLCIANTVAKAQQWYDTVLSIRIEDSFEVGLLHAKFPVFQREKHEKRWLGFLGKDGDRPKGCILVATQVVEQSVDIDADCLITELAPTDMLLQRMGRQWRHEGNSRCKQYPETFIVTRSLPGNMTKEEILNTFEKNRHVYCPYVLWRTFRVWNSRSSVSIPDDIRGLIEDTYKRGIEEPMAVQKLRKISERKLKKLRSHALSAKTETTSLHVGDDREGVATRYSELPSSQVLLVQEIDSTGQKASLKLMDGEMIEVDAYQKDFCITARLHRNLIPVATHWLRELGDTRTPEYLRRHFYEKIPVLVWNSVTGDLSLAGQPTGLSYSHDRGLARRSTKPAGKIRNGDLCTEYDDFDVFNKNYSDW